MTRVIAGAAGGRRLAVPPGNGTRPTSDRAKEALFSTWESLRGALDGARVLDLYAGSGAVGLEALSRGAAHVLLVESDPRAARVVRENAAALGLPGAEVRPGPAEKAVAATAARARRTTWSSSTRPTTSPTTSCGRSCSHSVPRAGSPPDALVTVERRTRGGSSAGRRASTGSRSRRYGEATLWYGRAADVTAGS